MNTRSDVGHQIEKEGEEREGEGGRQKEMAAAAGHTAAPEEGRERNRIKEILHAFSSEGGRTDGRKEGVEAETFFLSFPLSTISERAAA